jgi:phosphoserine aminotransferase
MLCLVTRWLKANGGLEAMHALNQRKAAKLYNAIDTTDFYSGTAIPECRSDMNVTWRIANEDLESVFIEEAAKENLKTLKGHRSVGGIRASIYNAFPEAGVDALISFMKEFEARHG